MELPKSGKKQFVVESTQPEDLSLEMGRPSWLGWTIATNKFNFFIIRSCATIDAWMDQTRM
jgi:hypothetical protein